MILKNGEGTERLPDWNLMEINIKRKFPKVDAQRMIVNYQILYYRVKFLDWPLWTKYKNRKLRLYSPTEKLFKASYELGGDLNDFGAWDAFLNCDNRMVLEEAVKWIDIAIKYDPRNGAFHDTKANLLHKLGRTKQAIAVQEIAVKLDPKDEWKQSALIKMKMGDLLGKRLSKTQLKYRTN